MAISIKGVNTGVIRKSNNFIALALKIKEPRNKESLFFLSVMELRDLLIALESRLHQKHKLDAAARLQYEQARDKVIKKMAENIPEILVDELKNADINRRVNTLELNDNQGENLTFVLTLHDGSKCELVINELQIEMLARAIIHAINNAEMRELALRITSLLDFLPLYDVDCQDNGNDKSRVYIRFQDRTAQKFILGQSGFAFLRRLIISQNHRITGPVDCVRSDGIRLMKPVQTADVIGEIECDPVEHDTGENLVDTEFSL